MKIINFIDNEWKELSPPQRCNILKLISRNFNVLLALRKYSFLVFISKLLSSNNLFDYNLCILIVKFSSFLKLKLFKKYFEFLKFANFLSKKNYPLYIKNKLPQVYILDNPKKNLLICFTGHGNQLNIPIPIFHSLAKDHFNAIAYFFCEEKDFYSSNLDLVNQAVNSLIFLNIWNEINILGTSAGGIPVLMLPKKEIIKKRVCFSPPIKRSPKLVRHIKNYPNDFFLNIKIFFDSCSKNDEKHYYFFKEILPKLVFESVIDNLSKYNLGRHGTLRTLLIKGKLFDLFDWLVN